MSEKKKGDQDKPKDQQKQHQRARTQVAKPMFTWPFGKRNLVVLVAAILVIALGYVFMAQGPHDSFSSLTLAPLLLVTGYLFLVPLAIIIRDPADKKK